MGRRKGNFLPFERAREIVRDMKFRSTKDFIEWKKTSNWKNIPRVPDRVYADKWQGWNDFLGTNNIFGGAQLKKYFRPYWEALAWAQRYAADNDINSAREWWIAHDRGEVPEDIPKFPEKIYGDWDGWDTWLGKSLRAKLIAEKNDSVELIALCYTTWQPRNIIIVVHAKGGWSELKEHVEVKDQRLVPFKMYIVNGSEEKKKFLQIVEMFASKERSGGGEYLIHNMSSLLFELDMEFDIFKPRVVTHNQQ